LQRDVKTTYDEFIALDLDTPETRRSILRLSADLTNTKKVSRLAAVCSSFASTAFRSFLPD
jgi:hypothetical protein